MSILNKTEKKIVAILNISRARAIFLLFFVHQGTESEKGEMKISMDLPISTQKKIKLSLGPGFQSSTRLDIFLKNIQIFLELEKFSTLLGFQVCPLLCHTMYTLDMSHRLIPP